MAINSHNVDELVAQGRYQEAARAASEAGDHARAADLYERIWEFGAASRAARAAGDLGRALRHAIDARDEALTQELMEALSGLGSDGARTAVDVLAKRRRFADAARLAEAAGDRDRAIGLYEEGRLDLDAARLLADAGRDREAGRLLERLVEHADPTPERARAHLLLGTLLSRRLQHEAAVRHLQEAAKLEDTRAAAQRALILELAALGLRDAARDVLLAVREVDPTLPLSIEDYLRDARAAPAPVPAARDVEIVGGRYRLEGLLGAGGSGRVFLARDEVSGRQLAIKLFNTSYARGHQSYERFVREARITSSLRHPNLVEVFAFSAEHGYLAMEYMVGRSLADRVAGGMRGTAARRMILDVLGGLELAHQRGIIHRDVKPANIFFDARGTAKLGDFGVAHLLDLGATQTGGLIGTLAYMAPEQITGAHLSIAADLYALGVTLFESLTGRLPFLGPDFVAQHLGEAPPLPSHIDPVIASGWDPIVLRLLAKSPGDRYDGIDQLRRDILAIDLGDDAKPKPLILPRAAGQRAPSESAPPPVRSDSAEIPAQERYQFETPIGQTELSQLTRALDISLDRSVIIERFQPEAVDEVTERRLYGIARGGGPFMQRSLSYDRQEKVAVFEAPAGSPIAEATAALPPTPHQVVRLLMGLALALRPLHESGAAHGAINGNAIVVDEQMTPTVLASGLGRAPADASARGDVAGVLAIIGKLAGCAPSPEGLVSRLAPSLSHPEKVALLAAGLPRNGGELYLFAEALEIALLKAKRRGVV